MNVSMPRIDCCSVDVCKASSTARAIWHTSSRYGLVKRVSEICPKVCGSNLYLNHYWFKLLHLHLCSQCQTEKNKLNRLNAEHKSCFERVFCFNLRSFSEYFPVHESVMCPLTMIIRYIYDRFCEHFLKSPVHCDVNC